MNTKNILRLQVISIIGILLVTINACTEKHPLPVDNTPSVKICDQTWMLKNLDVDKYRNGDPIPHVTDNTQWTNLTTGAWCYLFNDTANGVIYGKMYNWYAVNDPRGLAPKGWHIPTSNEYSTLENCLGGAAVAGDKLRETGTVHWSDNPGATNSSGFTALPGSNRFGFNGAFSLGNFNLGNWWTSTQYDNSYSWYHSLYGTVSNSSIFRSEKAYGFSVRCIKD